MIITIGIVLVYLIGLIGAALFPYAALAVWEPEPSESRVMKTVWLSAFMGVLYTQLVFFVYVIIFTY